MRRLITLLVSMNLLMGACGGASTPEHAATTRIITITTSSPPSMDTPTPEARTGDAPSPSEAFNPTQSRLTETFVPTSALTSTPGATPTTPDASALTGTQTAMAPPTFTMQILIPLYAYPEWYDPDAYVWDDIAEANRRVPITAIINPHDGPDGGPPNSDYQHGLDDLRRADVSLLGYVYTSYGERDLDNVKDEIDLYDQFFDIDGIFFDEVADNAEELPYYEVLYAYVKSRPHLDWVFLNPGIHTDESYFSRSVCDSAVIFEEYSSNWPGYNPDEYVSSYPAGRFAMLIHSVPDVNTMRAHIDLAKARNISYVYITDDVIPDPWDRLPAFWEAEVEYIESLNTNAP
jgi:hypothetical protein